MTVSPRSERFFLFLSPSLSHYTVRDVKTVVFDFFLHCFLHLSAYLLVRDLAESCKEAQNEAVDHCAAPGKK